MEQWEVQRPTVEDVGEIARLEDEIRQLRVEIAGKELRVRVLRRRIRGRQAAAPFGAPAYGAWG